jgi:hypothetical protein
MDEEERVVDEQDERSDHRVNTGESEQEFHQGEYPIKLDGTIRLEDLLGDFSEQTGASFG